MTDHTVDSLRYALEHLRPDLARRIMEPSPIFAMLREVARRPEPTLRRMVHAYCWQHDGKGLAGSREWKRLKRYRRRNHIDIPVIFPRLVWTCFSIDFAAKDPNYILSTHPYNEVGL